MVTSPFNRRVNHLQTRPGVTGRTLSRGLRLGLLSALILSQLLPNLSREGWTREPLGGEYDLIGNAAPASVVEMLNLQGSILGSSFDLGVIEETGIDGPPRKAIFPRVTVPSPGRRPPKTPTRFSNGLKRKILTQIDATGLTKASHVDVYFYGADGQLDKSPPVTLDGAAIAGMRRAVTKGGTLPDGGMVYLAGGKLRFRGTHMALNGGMLDLCGDTLCLRPEDPAQAELKIPLPVNRYLAEGWQFVYMDGIDHYYLSIDPTRDALDGRDGRNNRKLETSGKDTSLPYEVVILPDRLRSSKTGRALFEADVYFKSAALGFDVLKGRAKRPRPLETLLQMEDTGDFAVDGYDGPRYCRYYWSSRLQEVAVRDGQIKFRGSPAVARAEAMIIQNGRLRRFPRGKWCQGAEKLARRLTHDLEAAKTPELGDLRQVARVQQLMSWSRDLGITVSPRLAERLNTFLGAGSPTAVPHRTSGVGDMPGSFVRVDRRVIDGQKHLNLQFFSPEVARIEEAAEKFSNWQQGALQRWFERNNRMGAWMARDTEAIDRYEHALVRYKDEFARISGSETLPDLKGSRDFEWSVAASQRAGSSGFSARGLSYNIHGGVQLTAPKRDPDRKSWTEFLPNRRPFVARELDGDIHVWALDPGTPASGGITGDHLIARNAKVIDRHADRGTVRLLLEEVPGRTAEMWIERRLPSTPKFPLGIEWRQRLHDGTGDRNLVAWFVAGDPYSNTRPGYSFRTMPSRIHVEQLSPSAWIVEADIAEIGEDLATKWTNAETKKDVSKALSALEELARWGFIDGRNERLADIETWDQTAGAAVYRPWDPDLAVVAMDVSLGVFDGLIRERGRLSQHEFKALDGQIGSAVRALDRSKSADLENEIADIYQRWLDAGYVHKTEMVKIAVATHKALADRDLRLAEPDITSRIDGKE